MISQISKGVYVVKPEAQKRYQDTAAGEYTSVFTKSRANMWEMSKQQALMNIQEDSARYKAEMALYASRIADMDTRAKALEAAKADYLAGRTTADVAVKKSSRAEETNQQRNAIDFQKAGAEQFGLSSGGVSSSTGGTGSGASKKTASTGKVQEWETVTAPLSRPEKLAQLKQIGRPGGILADLDPAERDATTNQIVANMAAAAAGDLQLANPNMSAEEASDTANVDIINELKGIDPAAASAYEAYAIAPPSDTEGASSSSRVDRGQRSAPKFKNLGEMPAVVAVKDELMPSEVAEFDKSLAKIVEERKLLGLPPELPASDYITLARRIAAGRIAGQVGGPAAPFEQQLRLDKLLNASPEDREAIKAAFVASRAAPPAAAPATAVEPAAVAPASTPPAPTAPPEIRPEAADLMTEAEKQQFRDKLAAATARPRFTGAFADPEAEALYQEPSVPVTARTAALRAPSIPQQIDFDEGGAPGAGAFLALEPTRRIGIDRMLSQRPVSGGFSAKAAPIPDRMRLRAMSMQPEGYAVPAAEVLPQYVPPLDLDERGNVPPPAGMSAEEMLPMKLDTRRVAPMSPPPAEKPKPTASNYFQKRYEAANDLAQKPDKLNRLVASGAGKVVEAIYAANSKTNIPFERGWQEIALQYSNDVEKMKGAHEILLALDIASENKLKPKA